MNDSKPNYSLGSRPAARLAALTGASVQAGFPSPAEGYLEGALDLNRYCVSNPPATFFVRVAGDSMIGAGIGSGDLLVVDRSLKAQHNDIVVAVVDGEFTLKRLVVRGAQCWLHPENPDYCPLEITEDMEFEVWGRVTRVIREV